MISAEEVLDLIWEALVDSMGPDWNERLGARAVLQRLTDEGLVIVPVSFGSTGDAERLCQGCGGEMGEGYSRYCASCYRANEREVERNLTSSAPA